MFWDDGFMALALALHTASPDLGLALLHDDGICHRVWPLGRDLSSQLHVHLQDFISPHSWQALDWLAVCTGPGGFTSTRIGVVTARMLAQQLNIPLVGVSSLAAVAQQRGQPGDSAVTLPAKRGAVYGAIYHRSGSALTCKLSPQVYPAAAWAAQLAQWDGPLQQIELAPGEGLGDTAVSLLQVAQPADATHWSAVVPFYGQNPVE